MSFVYKQTANAFSIDLGQIPGLDGLQGLDLSKANTANNGLQGLDPTKADKTDAADKSDRNSKTDAADKKSNHGQISPENAEKFGHLDVMVNTIDLSGSSRPLQSFDFTIHVIDNPLSPIKFQGSEAGTDVKVGEGNYKVTEDIPDNLSIEKGDVNVHFSQNCLGDIQDNEDKACTITNTIH
jgi:hypothetical protein